MDTSEEEEEIDIAALQEEIDDLETQLAATRQQMAEYLKELGLAEPGATQQRRKKS